MIPEGDHARAADEAGQDVRHADGQRRRAAGARQDRRLADASSRSRVNMSGVMTKPQLEMVVRRLGRGRADQRRAAQFIAK